MNNLPDGALMYACANESVTLPWNYSLSAGETLEDVQWFYEGRSNEMIAVMTHGNFLPLPAFSIPRALCPGGRDYPYARHCGRQWQLLGGGERS